MIALVVRVPWLPPLDDAFFQFCSTLATVAGSLGGAYLLWNWQQTRRSSSVEACFKEVFRFLAQRANAARDCSVLEIYLRGHPKEDIVARWKGKTRPARHTEDGGSRYLDDDELVLYEMMGRTRYICRDTSPLLQRALADYQSLKSLLPELTSHKLRRLVHLHKIISDSLGSVRECAEFDGDPVRWHQSTFRPQIELLAEALDAWMTGELFGLDLVAEKSSAAE